MIEIGIKIVDSNGKVKSEDTSKGEVTHVFKGIYEEGDQIVVSSSKKDIYLMVQVDDALGQAFVYITKNEIVYNVPYGEKKVSYSPKTFSGELHYLWARPATEEEIGSYKNLALNVMDHHQAEGVYPHAHANVETRGEAVFAARNAIDGVRENRDHGKWPYQSWGINMQDDAKIRLDFGRKVSVDKILLYTRADFPHDNWWEQVTIKFSDESIVKWDLEKSYDPHVLNFKQKEIEWLEMYDLIKADDPSPFPALTQIEVYGVEA